MTIKKIIGASMIASLFIGLFVVGAIHTSFVFAAKTYLVLGILIGFVWMAVKLLTDDDA